METLVVLLATVAAISASIIPTDPKGQSLLTEKTYPRFIEFPDGEGNLHVVDLEAPPSLNDTEITRNAENNEYWLYTRRNPNAYQLLTINNANSVHNSNFDFSRPVVVIAHGWLSRGSTEPNPLVRTALLNKADYNVITLDWSRLAARDYTTSALGVPGVGRGLGQFMIFLNNLGVPWSNMHLVGFSLGAHLVGNAGRETGGRVARITALDPAGPLWNYNSNRVSPTDGVYVEAIHTDGGYAGLGIGSQVANADFFPNGGSNMPGCLTSLCNHNKAFEYFASSITNNHLWANLCTTSIQVTWNTCRGTVVEMGNDSLTKWANGVYRVNTARNYPY